MGVKVSPLPPHLVASSDWFLDSNGVVRSVLAGTLSKMNLRPTGVLPYCPIHCPVVYRRQKFRVLFMKRKTHHAK